MIWNGRVKKKKRSKEELRASAEARMKKLEEGAEAPFEGFEEDEVTGLIDVAIEKMKAASEGAAARVSNAAEELKKQAGELRKIGSDPPARKPA